MKDHASSCTPRPDVLQHGAGMHGIHAGSRATCRNEESSLDAAASCTVVVRAAQADGLGMHCP